MSSDDKRYLTLALAIALLPGLMLWPLDNWRQYRQKEGDNMPDKEVLARNGVYGTAIRDLLNDPEADPVVKQCAVALLYVEETERPEFREYLDQRIEKAAPSATNTESGAPSRNG